MPGSVLGKGVFELVCRHKLAAFAHSIKGIVDPAAVDYFLLCILHKHFGSNGGVELLAEHISGVRYQLKRNRIACSESLQVCGTQAFIRKYAHEFHLPVVLPVEGLERQRVALANGTAFG